MSKHKTPTAQELLKRRPMEVQELDRAVSKLAIATDNLDAVRKHLKAAKLDHFNVDMDSPIQRLKLSLDQLDQVLHAWNRLSGVVRRG